MRIHNALRRMVVTVVLVSASVGFTAEVREPARRPTRMLAGLPSSRVVNGEIARAGQWPTIIALMERRPNAAPTLVCGGTVIARQTVLTAAHCVDQMEARQRAEPRTIFLARENTQDLHTGQGRDIEIKSWTKHEDYDRSTYLNDVGLLALADSATVPSQALAGADRRGNASAGGEMATVAGFGRTSEGGALSSKLLQTDVPLLDQAECRRLYGAHRITEANFCAGFADGRVDSCGGDSGGPLSIMDAASGSMVQIGIVSWGVGCARRNNYGVYTSVGQFESWIRAREADAVFLSENTAPKRADAVIVELTDTGAIAPNPSDLAQLSIAINQGRRVKVDSFIEVRLTSSVAGIVVVFAENPDGTARQIYPSTIFPASTAEPHVARIKAGQSLTIPSAQQRRNGFRLQIRPPFGTSVLRALVVPERQLIVDLIKENADGRNLQDLAATIAKIVGAEAATRGAEPVRILPTDRAVASVRYDIEQ